MSDIFNSFLLAIQHLHLLGYFLAALFAFLESMAFVGMVVPGSLVIIIFGFLAAQGYLNLVVLIIFSMVGAILSDALSFFIGGHSSALFKKNSAIFKMSYLQRGEDYVRQHGSKAVFLARFFVPLRAIVPFVAGMFGMNRKKFYLYNILSAICWSVLHVLLGYFFGTAWQAIAVWSSRIGVFFSVMLFFVLIIYLIKRIIIKRGGQVVQFFASLIKSMGEGLKANRHIVKFTKAHPDVTQFLKNRFSLSRFSGFALTILAIVAIYAVSSVVGTLSGIRPGGAYADVDVSLDNLLLAFRHPGTVKIFLWVTMLGKSQVAIVITFLASLLLLVWKKKIYILPFWFTVAGSAGMGYLLKLIVHRPRPSGMIPVFFEHSWSWPSGHAIISVALYGFIVYILIRHFKKWKNKINTLFACLLVIIFVGFSRLYLGVHYLSDVWAGYMLGLLWLVFGIGLSEWAKEKNSLPRFNYTRKIIYLTSAIIAFALFAYAGYSIKYSPDYNALKSVADEVVSDDNLGQIFKSFGLSRYTDTLTGQPQEPMSLIIVAKDDSIFIDFFGSGGWNLSDEISSRSLLISLQKDIANKSYPTAPMTPSFWDNKINDFGFEKPTVANSIRSRHHARFWKTNIVTAGGLHIYVGTASLDSGVKWWGLTHRIKQDIDSERELIFNDLEKAGLIKSYNKEPFVDPEIGSNFTGDLFFTDGNAYFIVLK